MLKRLTALMFFFCAIAMVKPVWAGELMEYIADYNRTHSPTPPVAEAASAYLQDLKNRGSIWKDMDQFKQRLPRIAVVADGGNLLEIFAAALNAEGFTEEADYVLSLDRQAKHPENLDEKMKGVEPDKLSGSSEPQVMEQELGSDRLILANGQTLRGRVVEESAQGILFESDGGQVLWSKAEIKKVVKA